MSALILIRGGGDLATGVAWRLHNAGLNVVILELPVPLAVRRWVSFSEAVFNGRHEVEGVTAHLASDPHEAAQIISRNEIPVLVDPDANLLKKPEPLQPPLVLIDARLTKRPPDLPLDSAPLVIGLGPGFTAAENCHAVIETNRGHTLGRVTWHGSALSDTGLPDAVGEYRQERVLRAPVDGILRVNGEIGRHYDHGETIAQIKDRYIIAKFPGILRGMLRDGAPVTSGMKIGDLDPRDDLRLCSLISDKSLAIGGGVLEAILARPEIRSRLWS